MSGILATLFALLAQFAPQGQEGLVYSVDQSADAAVSSVGPLVGSTLAAALGLRAPFVFAAAVFGFAAAVVARTDPQR
jgi:MFS family permease